MAFGSNSYNSSANINEQVAFDQGLRSYMLRVYNWMASGVALTGIVAYLVVSTSLGGLFYKFTPGGVITATGLGFIAMLSPLAFVMVMSLGVNRLSKQTVQTLFWVFCALMGVSMANIFYIYTASSITSTFFIVAAMFAGMSLYGYTTRRDLTGFGAILGMGIYGIFLAMLVSIVMNFFAPGSNLFWLNLAINVLGVIIFTGLIATNTQSIKVSYIQFSQYMGVDEAAKRSVYDALSLYLNFINLFNFLLQLVGMRQGSNE